MGNSTFRFRQFQVSQDRCAMKVGTDAILLGAWAPADEPVKILDIGTGTGLLALMMAQRFPATRIDAIEIEKAAFDQASENFTHSPWPDRLRLFHKRLQDFEPESTYDLLICNPPFFQHGMRPPKASREQARHTDSLPFADLAQHSRRLSKETSQLALILPLSAFAPMNSAMDGAGWYLQEQVRVHPLAHKSPHRYLLRYSPQKGPVYQDQFFIEDQPGRYSAYFQALTRDFYL